MFIENNLEALECIEYKGQTQSWVSKVESKGHNFIKVRTITNTSIIDSVAYKQYITEPN